MPEAEYEGARRTSVADFYDGKSIFITGGTGFVGKVLIEKLLYSCPGVEKIYVLIRQNKGLNEEQKFEKLLQSQVFTRLREERPQDLAKIVPVAGDLKAPDLGINPEDVKTLVEEVSVVFHSAATVNFNDPLREALAMNVEGAKKVLDLGRQMKKLQAFVHISTAFCNMSGSAVEEKVYSPPAKLEDVYKFLEQDDQSSKKTMKLLNGHLNTYTFTKALAETLLVQQRQDLPLVILRPSIVLPAKSEPMPGWVDVRQGGIGLITAIAKGWVQGIPGDPKGGTDFIPVDHVSNMAVIAAASAVRSDQVSVYHCCTKTVNYEKYENMSKYIIAESVKHGYNDVPKPRLYISNNSILLELVIFYREKIPAYLLDLKQIIKRQKPRYIHFQSLLSKLRNALTPFICDNWEFRSDRAQALVTSLPPSDRRVFPCHPADIEWKIYLETCIRGVITYLSKSKL